MSTFRTYYDTSGAESAAQGLVVTVGIVSQAHKWARFDAEWQKFLEESGLPYLRMSDLAAGTGPFARFKDDDEGQSAILRRAAQVIKRRTHKVFAGAVDIAGYREADQAYQLVEYLGREYSLTAGTCLGMARAWLREKHGAAAAEDLFEKGDVGQGLFKRIIESEGFSPSFIRKYDPKTGERLAPFQASDFLAWEVRQLYLDAAAGRRLRPVIHLINKLIPIDSRIHNKDSLLTMCRERSADFPPRAA